VICISYIFILQYIKHLVHTLITACYKSNIIVFQVVYSGLYLFDGHVLSNINLMFHTSSTYLRF